MGLLGNIAGLLEAAALTCEPGKRGLARQRIAQFAQSTTGPAWPNLDRVGVAQRLRELVDDPQLVNQGHLGVCAVAVFLRCWIQRDPLAFVNFAATLYETGTATLGSLTIKPNATLIAQNYDALQDGLWIDDFWGGRGPAEWMVMSSLRDAANQLLPFNGTPTESDTAKSTSSPQLTNWLTETNLYQTVTYATSARFDSPAGIRTLAPSATTDVLLWVHSQVLEEIIIGVIPPPASGWAGVIAWLRGFAPADHVIRLIKPIEPAADEFFMTIWTWGKESPLTVSRDQLNSLYSGHTIAVAKST